MQYLVFQVYAPLVSWGDIAVGGERRSSRQPSRSAILGLIGAALGLERTDEEALAELHNGVGVAVQLFSGGSLLKDFHTVQVPKHEKGVMYHTRQAELRAAADKIDTILSRREYRCDAYSVVAVYRTPQYKSQYSLECIASSLKQPRFHLYFGRKTCAPALPLAPELVDADNLKHAFSSYTKCYLKQDMLPVKTTKPEWLQEAFQRFPSKTLVDEQVTYFWEDGAESGFDHELQSVERYDQPLNRRRWQFTFRREFMAVAQKTEVLNVY